MCSPLADVIHSGDGMLCLCRLKESNSSLSGVFVIHHCIVNAHILISITCDVLAVYGARNICQDEIITIRIDKILQTHILY